MGILNSNFNSNLQNQQPLNQIDNEEEDSTVLSTKPILSRGILNTTSTPTVNAVSTIEPDDADYPNEIKKGSPVAPPHPDLFQQTVAEIEDFKNAELENYKFVYGRRFDDNIDNAKNTYNSVRTLIKDGDWGDTFLHAHNNTYGVSTALTAGTITAVQQLVESVPDFIGDATEIAVAGLEKVLARDFRGGLGEFELKVGPYSRKTSNLFRYESPEKAADAFLEFLGALLVGTENEPAILEALPTGPASLFARGFYGLENKLQKLAKQEITAQFKRANGQLETMPNAQRIQFATQEELAKKQQAAKLIADENKPIRNEMIIDFENKLALNAGLTRESEDFRRISVEDADGNLSIDDGLSKQVGTDILEQYQAYAPIVEKLNTDSLTSPILNPDKLNGLVAMAVDLQKKQKIKFDPKKTIIRNLEESVIEGKLPTDQALLDTLNDHGLSFEDFILTVVGSGSDAGRTLQKLSMIRKASKTVAEKDIIKDKKFLDQQSVVYNNLRRIENIRRGGLVSQIATATRNLTSATMIAGPDVLVNMMDTVLYKYVDDINKSNGFVDKAFNTIIPIGTAKEVLPFSPSWRNSFRQMKLMLTDPKNSVEIAKMILDRPEYASKYERMFIRLNEMQNANKGKATTTGGKIVDGALTELEDFVNILNVPNRWQEHIIRSTYMLGDLERIIKREWNINFMDEIENGKLLDIMNDASEFRPEGARSFGDIMEESIMGALDVTFSSRPDSPALAFMSDIITKSVVGTAVLPFPNFMFKSMERIASYVPGTALIKTAAIPGASPTRNPMYQVLKNIMFKDGKQLTTKERRLVGNNLVGLAAIYAAYDYVKSDEAPADYKEIALDAERYTDISPQYPMRPILFLGKMAEQYEKGTHVEWFSEKYSSGEVAKTFAGSNLRVGSGNFIVNSVREMLDAGSEGPKGMGITGEVLGRLVGNYVSTFIVPYNQILEAEKMFGLRPNVTMDTKGEPVIGFKQNAIKNVVRPFKKYASPSTERSRLEMEYIFGKRKQETGLANILSGIKVKAPTSKEGEYLIDLGFEDFRLGSQTDSPSGRRYEAKFLEKYLEAIIYPQLLNEEDRLEEGDNTEQYKRAKLKAMATTLFSSFRTLAKEGRLNASGSFYRTMQEFDKLPATIKKIAILDYKKEKDTNAIDFNNEDTLRELTIRAKETRKFYSGIKSALTN